MDNTGLWIPWFDSCQLITTWMCNIRLYLGSQTSLLWCLRTVGGTVTWLPNFVGWIDLLSYGTTFARQTFWTSTGHLTHRGYYIAACWRYEIFLLVLKKYFTRSLCSLVKYFFNTSREISYLQAAMLCSIYYINTSELPNHFTLIVFWCERRDLLCSHSNGDIFTPEDNMLFSHVKISSFRAKAHLVLHWCLYNKFKSAILSRVLFWITNTR